jgi:hypothetical protein
MRTFDWDKLQEIAYQYELRRTVKPWENGKEKLKRPKISDR